MEVKQGYKKTEIGIIPEDWDVLSVDENFNFYQNNTYSRDCLNNVGGEIQNIHYGDILIKFSSIIDCDKENIPFLNSNIKAQLNNRTVQTGDIIFADTAEDNTVGKAVEVLNVKNRKILSGLHTIFLRPKTGLFTKKYLGYFINSSIYHDQLLPYIVGIKVSSISKKTIRGTLISRPSILEQQAIATALSDVDELISSLTRLIEKKKNIKQGTMQELLTGKKRLPGFTGEWETKKLKDIAFFFQGTGLSKSKICIDGAYPCILYGELFTNYSQVIKEVKSKTNIKEGLLSITDDILLPGSTTTVGIDLATASALKKQDILLGGDIIVMRKKELDIYNSEFLANYLTHIAKNKIAEIAQGITIIHLHGSRLQEISIKIPKVVEEQTAIATILSDMDEEIKKLEQKLNKYKAIKQGMMQELLTGRIRLI